MRLAPEVPSGTRRQSSPTSTIRRSKSGFRERNVPAHSLTPRAHHQAEHGSDEFRDPLAVVENVSRPAGVIRESDGRIDTEHVVESRQKILRVVRPILWSLTDRIGRADDLTHPQSAAGEHGASVTRRRAIFMASRRRSPVLRTPLQLRCHSESFPVRG